MSEQNEFTKKELTRVITLQITHIVERSADDIDFMEEELQVTAEYVADRTKKSLKADDVQVLGVQGFIREVDENGNV